MSHPRYHYSKWISLRVLRFRQHGFLCFRLVTWITQRNPGFGLTLEFMLENGSHRRPRFSSSRRYKNALVVLILFVSVCVYFVFLFGLLCLCLPLGAYCCAVVRFPLLLRVLFRVLLLLVLCVLFLWISISFVLALTDLNNFQCQVCTHSSYTRTSTNTQTALSLESVILTSLKVSSARIWNITWCNTM